MDACYAWPEARIFPASPVIQRLLQPKAPPTSKRITHVRIRGSQHGETARKHREIAQTPGAGGSACPPTGLWRKQYRASGEGDASSNPWIPGFGGRIPGLGGSRVLDSLQEYLPAFRLSDIALPHGSPRPKSMKREPEVQCDAVRFVLYSRHISAQLRASIAAPGLKGTASGAQCAGLFMAARIGVASRCRTH